LYTEIISLNPPMPIPSLVMTTHAKASQFLHNPRDAFASVAQGCNCEFAVISCYDVVSQKRYKLAPKLL